MPAARLYGATDSLQSHAAFVRLLDSKRSRLEASPIVFEFLKILLFIPFADTQCGFKAFTRTAAVKIFPLQRVMRWGFDPEILYLAHRQGFKVAEIPVRWGHDDGSRLRVWRDGFRMGWDALKVRWYAINRKYRV